MRTLLTSAVLFAAFAAPAFAQCADGERLFQHRMLLEGEACIPADPERIAFTMPEAIPAILFEQEQINQNWYSKSFLENYPGALDGEEFATLPDIDYFPESDPEILALANPDLIVGSSWVQEANAKVAHLAPLITIDWTDEDVNWETEQNFVATLLGKEAEEAAMMAALEARMEALRNDLGNTARSFAVVQPGEQAATLVVATARNFGTQIMLDAGMRLGPDHLSLDEADAIGARFWYPLSLERIHDIDVDYLVVLGGFDPAIADEIIASPIWNALPAVAEGRVFEVHGDGQQYVRENVAYAHLVIDDIYRNVLRQDPQAAGNPNPFNHWID